MYRTAIFAYLSCVCLAGCGSRDKLKLYPVAGTLLVSGEPAANAKIAFHPLSPGAAALPVATTAPDGTFRLTTYAAGDGAPAGEYAVTVVWPDDSLPVDECVEAAHDRLQGRYADPTKTKLRATVRPEATNEVTLKTSLAGSWSLPRMRDAKRD